MENSIETSTFLTENNIVWYNPDPKTSPYQKAKITKIHRINNTLTLKILSKNEILEKIEISKIEEAAIKPARNYLVSNLEIINCPELIEYMKWILEKKERYFCLNKALFFINNNLKVKNFFDVEKNLEILENGRIQDFSEAPDFEMFISENLHFLKFFGEMRYLFFLGQKNSAKTVHFKFFIDYVERMFFEKNKDMKKKIRAVLLVFFAIVNFLDDNGKNENFSFCTYKFVFDEDFKFAGISLKLISLYSTFITERKNIYGLPIIMYMTKKYYKNKNQKLDHLKEIFELPENIDNSVIDILENYSKKIFEAFEILKMPKEFLDKIFLTFRILLNFINLEIGKNLENEWEIEKNEIYKDLISILKIDEEKFMEILINVGNTDDGSMRFGKNKKSFRDYISTIVYVVYEKLIHEITHFLNKKFSCNTPFETEEPQKTDKNKKTAKTSNPDKNKKTSKPSNPDKNKKTSKTYKTLCLIEYCGFRNKKINYFDDFHINYLNEQIFSHYADTTISHEKTIYKTEGLESHFPQNLKFSTKSTQILKIINNLRKPPGIYQILETVNRLNKTDKSFMSEIRKYFKSSELVEIGKRSFVTLRHTFGDVCYDFSNFVAKNKCFLISDYKLIFGKLDFGFLEKYDVKSESVNKNYKSDLYRHFLFTFLEKSKKDSASFLNCFNFTEDDVENIVLQMKIFKLEDIIKLIKELFPYKIALDLFVKRYLEVFTKFNDFFYQVENFEENLHDLSKKIVDFVFRDISRPKILYGKTMVFSSNALLKEMEARLLFIKNREAKWKDYLVVKMNRFLFVIKARRFFVKMKKDKKLAKEILLKMKIVLIKKSEYKKKIEVILALQRKRRNFTFLRKLKICVKKFRRIKETFLTFFLRVQFLKKKRSIIKFQRRFRIFNAITKIRKKIFIKSLINFLIENAIKKNSEKLLKNIKKGFSKYLLKQVIFLKNQKILKNFTNYIKNEILEKKVRVIQRCYRRYNYLKWFKNMKKIIVIIQKNLKTFMWRKNYLLMKNGIIKIQRMFRDKRVFNKKEIRAEFYKSEKLENLLLKNCQKIIKKNFEINKKKIQTRIKNYKKKIKKPKHDKPLFFSTLINLEISPNLEKEEQFSILDGFSKFFDKLEKSDDFFFELKPNDNNIWFITNSKKIFIWGKINFLKINTKNSNLKEIKIFGNFPEFIETGTSSTSLFFSKKNEIKFFGDFEIYGKSGKISKKSDKITTEFNSDFKIHQIRQNGKNTTILSKTGEVLLWPFFSPKTQKLARLKITPKQKITQIGCGVDFSVFLSQTGIVYTIGNSNSCGECGNSTFKTNGKIYEMKFFQILKENIVQIAVGFKHVVALSMKNKVFAWGSNFENQIGSKFRLNYAKPKFVKLKEVLKSGEKILKISAGKFSSFAVLKNQKVYLWGKVNRKSKLPCLYRFEDFLDGDRVLDFGKNSDFFIFKVKSVWNDFMSATYFQIFDLSLMMDKRKSTIIYNKLDQFWGPENRIFPELYEDCEVIDKKTNNSKKIDKIKKKQKIIKSNISKKSELKIDKKYLNHFPKFLQNSEVSKNSENSLLLVNNELVEKFVSVNEKIFSMEDVVMNWKGLLERYRDLKTKKIEDLEDEEKEFIEFFLKMKKILLT